MIDEELQLSQERLLGPWSLEAPLAQRCPGDREGGGDTTLATALGLATGFVADVAAFAVSAAAFGAAWIVVGVAVADWLVPDCDIASFRAYVGAVALVWAATVAIYLPLYLIRRRRALKPTGSRLGQCSGMTPEREWVGSAAR